MKTIYVIQYAKGKYKPDTVKDAMVLRAITGVDTFNQPQYEAIDNALAEQGMRLGQVIIRRPISSKVVA